MGKKGKSSHTPLANMIQFALTGEDKTNLGKFSADEFIITFESLIHYLFTDDDSTGKGIGRLAEESGFIIKFAKKYRNFKVMREFDEESGKTIKVAYFRDDNFTREQKDKLSIKYWRELNAGEGVTKSSIVLKFISLFENQKLAEIIENHYPREKDNTNLINQLRNGKFQ